MHMINIKLTDLDEDQKKYMLCSLLSMPGFASVTWTDKNNHGCAALKNRDGEGFFWTERWGIKENQFLKESFSLHDDLSSYAAKFAENAVGEVGLFVKDEEDKPKEFAEVLSQDRFDSWSWSNEKYNYLIMREDHTVGDKASYLFIKTSKEDGFPTKKCHFSSEEFGKYEELYKETAKNKGCVLLKPIREVNQ